MKLESEHTNETEATPELVAALLRDAPRRGGWLIRAGVSTKGTADKR